MKHWGSWLLVFRTLVVGGHATAGVQYCLGTLTNDCLKKASSVSCHVVRLEPRGSAGGAKGQKGLALEVRKEGK